MRTAIAIVLGVLGLVVIVGTRSPVGSGVGVALCLVGLGVLARGGQGEDGEDAVGP